MGGIGATELLVLFFAIAILGLIFIFPYWKIFTKAGFSGWLSLLMLIPIANIIILFYLAFSEWPALKKTN